MHLYRGEIRFKVLSLLAQAQLEPMQVLRQVGQLVLLLALLVRQSVRRLGGL